MWGGSERADSEDISIRSETTSMAFIFCETFPEMSRCRTSLRKSLSKHLENERSAVRFEICIRNSWYEEI